MQVYLDNSATTPVAPEVKQAMLEVIDRYYGNPSSLHSLGGQAEKLLVRSREVIAEALDISPHEVVFTSGGTESNNLAIKGIAFQYRSRGKHLITSQIEHSAVYDVCQALERDFDFEVTYLPVDQNGIVSLDHLKKALRDDTILVSIMHVNNEMGALQPLEEIGQLIKRYPKTFFHVDQVQGIGKAPLNIKDWGIDLLSISGHKIHAPKGTGLLYVREGVELYPLFHGGGQEKGRRSGTENVPGIVALAKALRLIKEKEKEHRKHFLNLRRKLLAELQGMEGVFINTPLDEQLAAPHIINLSCPGVKPEVLVHALAEQGIYVSTTSACSSKAQKPSRTLEAMGLASHRLHSAIRISFSIYSTQEEVDQLIKALKRLIPELKHVMRV